MAKPKPFISPTAAVQDAADWIEFQAITSKRNTVKFVDLTRMLENSDEFKGTDFRDTDGRIGDIANRWISEIQIRVDILKKSYPFEIVGEKIKFLGTEQATEGRISYLLCLILSHAANTDVIDGKSIFEITNNDVGRQHFQTISTIASSGYLKGNSISFGWPRLDGTNFATALNRVLEMICDGAVILNPPLPGAPDKVKDYEIDVISWLPTNDNMPGKIILAGQVASGANWNEKRLRRSVISSLDAWVHPHFASRYNVTTAIFIPFCILANPNEITADKIHYLVGNSLENIVFYRYRIPFYVNIVYEKKLAEEDGILIELVDQFEGVSNWVGEKLTPLLPT